MIIFGGLVLPSLAFGRKVLATLEASSGIGTFELSIPFFLPFSGRRFYMAEILLTGLFNFNSNKLIPLVSRAVDAYLSLKLRFNISKEYEL